MKTEPTYTTNWFEARQRYFEKYLTPLAGRDYLNFLEVGVFEGRSVIWCLDNILTAEHSSIVCVDTFMGSPEHEHLGAEVEGLFDRFKQNVEPYKQKVITYPGSSYLMLRSLPLRAFDFVYIDGSHYSADVLEDAVLAWRNLRKGGIMAFDDYLWTFHTNRYGEEPKPMHDNEEDLVLHEPKIAIDAFLEIYKHRYELLDRGEQVWIKKI